MFKVTGIKHGISVDMAVQLDAIDLLAHAREDLRERSNHPLHARLRFCYERCVGIRRAQTNQQPAAIRHETRGFSRFDTHRNQVAHAGIRSHDRQSEKIRIDRTLQYHREGRG